MPALRRHIIRAVAFLTAGSLSSCTSMTPHPELNPGRRTFPQSEIQDRARLVWELQLQGIATDLTIARESGDVLVSVNPDPEGFKRLPRPTTILYGPNGKLRWQFAPRSRVRSQTLSPDGQLAIVSAYNEQLTAIEGDGKIRWQVTNLCNPILLPLADAVLCYFDDDNRPRVAFEVLSLKDGTVKYTHAVDREILHLAVSRDGSSVAYALAGGQVRLLGADFQTRWSHTLEGEALDIVPSEGSTPIVWILEGAKLGSRPHLQRLLAFSASGEVLARASIPWHASSLKIGEDHRVFAYGNSPQGQVVGGFLLAPDQRSIVPLFRGQETKFADFSSPLRSIKNRLFFGMERSGHQILGTDAEGKVRWSSDLEAEDAGFQIEVASLGDELRLVLGTDSGWLRAFEISPEP